MTTTPRTSAVRVANGGLRALQVTGQAPPPGLLLSAGMTLRMDGSAVVRALPANPITADTSVMLLAARRPHRAALTHAPARAVIAAERGRQYDPDVTDVFLGCSHSWAAVAMRHA